MKQACVGLAHRLGLVRNPLRRTTDRIQITITALTAAATLVAAATIGTAIYQSGLRRGHSLAAADIALGMLLLLWCLRGVAIAALNRRRLSQWDRHWAALGIDHPKERS